MTEDDFELFSATWDAAVGMYGKPPTNMQTSMAFDLLKTHTIGQIKTALRQHMQSQERGQFAPRPADIIRQINGDDGAVASNAWEKLRRGIRRVGNYRSAVFDDPIIHLCVTRMGGWSSVTSWDETEIPFRQQEFLSAYRSFRQAQSLPNHVPIMLGSHAVDQPEDVTLIGDREACVSVMRQGKELPNHVRAKVSNLTARLTRKTRDD